MQHRQLERFLMIKPQIGITNTTAELGGVLCGDLRVDRVGELDA